MISGISLVPKSWTSLIKEFFNITCNQVGHKFKNGKRGFRLMDELATGGIAELFPSWIWFAYHFMLAQSGKQCKPVQVYSFLKNHLWMLFQKLLVGATSPNPFEHHLAMMATRSFWAFPRVQHLANLSRCENTGFEKTLRRNLHRSKKFFSGDVPHTCFFYNYPVE